MARKIRTMTRTLMKVNKVMALLQHRQRTHGRCPGHKELMRLTAIPYSTLRYYLTILRDDYGLIAWESGKPNSIHILHTVSGGD